MARTIAAVIADIKAAVAASPVIGTAGTDPLTSDSNAPFDKRHVAARPILSISGTWFLPLYTLSAGWSSL